MRIIDAKWSDNINIYIILCDCGNEVIHRTDRWWAKCENCGRKEHLTKIRHRYYLEHLDQLSVETISDEEIPSNTPYDLLEGSGAIDGEETT